jgi:hypothetical protein
MVSRQRDHSTAGAWISHRFIARELFRLPICEKSRLNEQLVFLGSQKRPLLDANALHILDHPNRMDSVD